jgi:hypothetical protein
MPTTAALRLDEIPSESLAPAAELEAGKLVAGAAILVCAALEQYQSGRSTLETNRQGAELIVRLHALQSAAPDVDFATAGARELRRLLEQDVNVVEALCRQCNLDQVLAMIVGWPLTVLQQVTADEQARIMESAPGVHEVCARSRPGAW